MSDSWQVIITSCGGLVVSRVITAITMIPGRPGEVVTLVVMISPWGEKVNAGTVTEIRTTMVAAVAIICARADPNHHRCDCLCVKSTHIYRKYYKNFKNILSLYASIFQQRNN